MDAAVALRLVREQLKVLGGYQGYLCGPKAHGEVVAEKLPDIYHAGTTLNIWLERETA